MNFNYFLFLAFFFLSAACVKAEAATDFIAFVDLGSFSIFEALLATDFEVFSFFAILFLLYVNIQIFSKQCLPTCWYIKSRCKKEYIFGDEKNKINNNKPNGNPKTKLFFICSVGKSFFNSDMKKIIQKYLWIVLSHLSFALAILLFFLGQNRISILERQNQILKHSLETSKHHIETLTLYCQNTCKHQTIQKQ